MSVDNSSNGERRLASAEVMRVPTTVGGKQAATGWRTAQLNARQQRRARSAWLYQSAISVTLALALRVTFCISC